MDIKILYTTDFYKKKKYFLDYKGTLICALFWKDGAYPIIYDSMMDGELSKHKWYVYNKGNKNSNVICSKRRMFMYAIVACASGIYVEDHYITHIGSPLDNRVSNLKITSEKPRLFREPKKNRKIDSDLIAAGITQLPKYVCYNKHWKRFVISGHPYQKKEIVIPSGANMTIHEQYQQAVEVLEDINAKWIAMDERGVRLQEYQEIYDFLMPMGFFNS